MDYCVGHAASGALRDPSVSMTGVSVNAATRTVTVTDNDVTLDDYDFSLNGGWSVVVLGDNARILNSKFLVGASNNQPILAMRSATNLYVGYCVVDGNSNPDVGGLIEMRGSGTLTVEYSWLKNAGGDIIQLHGSGGNVVVAHNLFENSGMAPGAHGDYTEFIGGPYSATIVFNTTMQSGGTTQGFMVEPDVGSSPGIIISGEIGHNTFTAKGGGINAYTGITVADIVNTFTVHDNYFDPKGTLSGLAFGGNIRGGPNDRSPKSIYVNNVNMLTGAVLEDAGATAKRPRR
ncbi:hypothetical protein IVB15_30230 [Bradyrhizobium sp. 182]|uniref:right-handed parallel beta-helix repeat-containing protein n=1 Tax=unclassified Bradyrhizobium TaxID=2631580 RepID=UPI001FF7B64D|nr:MULTISPECIES: right-handed parallel beta-helix repeat-containing protein [unclassified Bradyrhizobium]MCK1424821.1 hypothetical protein [Bradyrhizobium sp. CW12]MCK1531851.1 hypothetical protein [Bradyrhizobium sp. 182]MCK1646502.1 hypothetical protein [Bradyrhizobium sp. 154]